MARRHAVLVKLKKGVTRGEVRKLVALLREVGDPEWVKDKEVKKIVREYDDQYGDPDFYIP